MAHQFKKIDPRLWDDEDFRELTTTQKLVAIYAFSGQSNQIGLFAFSPAKGAEQLDMAPAEFNKALDVVCAQLSWQHDKERRVFFIPTWWKYNHPNNRDHFIGNLKDLHDVPKSPLIASFLENKGYLADYLHETLADTSPDRCTGRVPPEAEAKAKGKANGSLSPQERRNAEADRLRKEVRR